jgi:hypothetical protein
MQDLYSRRPKFDGGLVYDVNHCRDDKDQQDLLPKRPTIPRHLEYPGYLVDRPGPDEPDKSEDRRDTLLQELQQLIENLLHLRSLRAREEILRSFSFSEGATLASDPRMMFVRTLRS